jgi:hypothetical protein
MELNGGPALFTLHGSERKFDQLIYTGVAVEISLLQ